MKNYRHTYLRRKSRNAPRIIMLLVIAALLAFLWMVPMYKGCVDENLSMQSYEDAQNDSSISNAINYGDGMNYVIEETLDGDGGANVDHLEIADQDARAIVINSSRDSINSSISDSDELSDESTAHESVNGIEGSSLSNDENEVQFGSKRPASGYIFESNGEGIIPQLTVVAPADKDAFVILNDIETKETTVSFYVRASTTVKVCVPPGIFELIYALGAEWLGIPEEFGEDGIYAISDKRLDFTSISNSYTYIFGTEDGNVNPIPIDKSEFNEVYQVNGDSKSA